MTTDGVMCQLCFEDKRLDELWVDSHKSKWDICVGCRQHEVDTMKRMVRQNDLKFLVGHNEQYVHNMLDEAGIDVRTIIRDGAGLMKINDARSDRVNLEVRDGLVTEAYNG